MKTEQSETEKYLRQIKSFKESWVKDQKLPKDHVYLGAEDFVLQNGTEFKVDYDQLNNCKMGKPKECYKNAFDLAMTDTNLIYVEGFASTVIPTMHAWVVNKDGVIFDPTWRMKDRLKDYPPTGYYGVMFSIRQCWKVMEQSGCYGLLDAWQAGWPLYKQKFVKEVQL